MAPDLASLHWWQRTILYQVYVRSFCDSNGDGIGDLPGLLSKIDYFQWLGAGSLWLSPIYPSPNVDMGYDVSNYVDVHPDYGTLADFDRLLAEVHRRDLKLLLDFVPNHTSREHPWFVESRSSRDNPYRDWYIWHDPAPGGGPPNNWLSGESGSAWEWDEQTGQYYLHSYLPAQPDLNWRSPHVHVAMLDVMRFWLDRGVDGFRVDAVAHLVKDARLRNNPPNPQPQPKQPPPIRQQINTYAKDQPEVHGVIAWMRRMVDLYRERILIGELYLRPAASMTYYGPAGLTFPFNFELIGADWDQKSIRAVIDRYESKLASDEWPNWVLGNHDVPRIATRVGTDLARLAAVLLLTLRGTPTIYYGDELGMIDSEVPEDRRHDQRGRRMPGFGRDPQRTPMHWYDGPQAGFTHGRPWLPVAGNCARVNVDAEREDPGSMLNLYRRLIELRRQEPALEVGDYAGVELGDSVVAYCRSYGSKCFLIVLSFSAKPLDLHLPKNFSPGRVRLSTVAGSAKQSAVSQLNLRPHEALVIEICGQADGDSP